MDPTYLGIERSADALIIQLTHPQRGADGRGQESLL
jgi:hypothetical protein